MMSEKDSCRADHLSRLDENLDTASRGVRYDNYKRTF